MITDAHQVHTDIDERAQMGEEGNYWLPMKSQANPFDQTAGCFPFHLSSKQKATNTSVSFLYI